MSERDPRARERFHHEEVSIEDLPLAKSANNEFYEEDSGDDFIVLESELEKIKILLKGQEEGIEMEMGSVCSLHDELRSERGQRDERSTQPGFNTRICCCLSLIYSGATFKQRHSPYPALR